MDSYIYCRTLKSAPLGKRPIQACLSTCQAKCQALLDLCPAIQLCKELTKGKRIISTEERQQRSDRMKQIRRLSISPKGKGTFKNEDS